MSGYYYVRVKALNLQNPHLTYSISVTSFYNSSLQQGTFIKGLGQISKPAYSIPNSATAQPLALRYTSPTPQQATVVAYNPSTQVSFTL